MMYLTLQARQFAATGVFTCLAILSGCKSSSEPSPLSDFSVAVASPIRTAEDREADASRKPLALLQFAQVRPGMNALDLAAGGGYTAQLLALVVGPTGTVWAQLDKPRPAMDKRLAAQPQAQLRPILRGFEDPYPSDGPKLDLVTLVLSYHDIAYAPVDRAKMNRRLFDALKSGGHLVVIDHAAKAGTDLNDTKTLHRIDQSTVLADFKAAGFVLEEEGNFLRNPADPREKGFYDLQIATDKFALRFVRP